MYWTAHKSNCLDSLIDYAQAAGAAKAYVEAARLEPGAADARLNLAGALQRARAPSSAVEAECRKAFELDASLARRRATRLSRSVWKSKFYGAF